MAPKRKQKRSPHRSNVRFRKKDEAEFSVGYTKNVSVGGLFIGTIRPLPPGTEIVVEIKESAGLRQRPAVVVHAARVSALLASVRTSGMGVRFLDRDESGERPVQQEAEVDRSAGERTAEGPSSASEAPDPIDLQVDLSEGERFREAFRRDIQHGVIFVPGPIGKAQGEEVEIGVRVPGGGGVVALRGRVDRETICRCEAYGELGAAGVMLVLLESESTVTRLRCFL